jgi:Protein of unknown function DUF2834
MTSPTRTGHPALVAAYLTLSLIGLVGTWWFNLSFIAAGGTDYLGGWFANPASSSAAVDIIVMAVAASIVIVVEGRRLGWRLLGPVMLVVLSFALAVSFTFPLFLALRERTLAGGRGEGH